MKKLLILAFLFAGISPLCASTNDAAVKLSLWDQLAIAAPANVHNVTGLDFGIGSHTDTVTGLQWDLVWAQTHYELRGASLAWLVSMGNHITGAQSALFDKAEDVVGAQIGGVNMTQSIIGAQIGFYNQADFMHGLQLGFVNYAREIDRGLQVGILNVAENGYLPVMVFVNGRF